MTFTRYTRAEAEAALKEWHKNYMREYSMNDIPSVDVLRLPVVHRTLLGKLSKPRELPERDLHISVMVAGLNRRRGRGLFTDATVELAIAQLVKARLMRKFRKKFKIENAEDIKSSSQFLLDAQVGYGAMVNVVDYVGLTVEGWIMIASLELDKQYR